MSFVRTRKKEDTTNEKIKKRIGGKLSMKALIFDGSKEGLTLNEHWPCPLVVGDGKPSEGPTVAICDSSSHYQAVLKMLHVAICNTDLEITKGYVEGFCHVLGHEGVGEIVQIVETKTGIVVKDHSMLHTRVVVEINCPCDDACNDIDRVPQSVDRLQARTYVRNHAPKRTVLGIIARDGLMAEYCMVPLDNCHVVPESLSNREAAFCEPLAAAYRIVEQALVRTDGTGDEHIAVVGDGKLGLLIAHVLSSIGCHVCHYGRHERKLQLVAGTARRIVVPSDQSSSSLLAADCGAFDVVVEASGSPDGVMMSLGLLRPMGRLVLKSTCALEERHQASMPVWSAVANDIVVHEKVLVGSRCGPMEKGLDLLQDESTKKLVNAMIDDVFHIDQGIQAFAAASKRGALKVQITF